MKLISLARNLLASLSPKERKALGRAWDVLVTVVVGILVQKILGKLLVSRVGVAAIASAATLGGVTVADQGPAPFEPMAHENLSAEVAGTPLAADPVARAAALEANELAARDTTSGPDRFSEPRTLAAFEQPGCVTKPVRNYSSRNGARPALLVPHYTVSANRDGWGDVDAIASYFNTSRAQASSHYIVDFEAHCAYLVSEQAKAWTQGWFNPWSISIEFIATGKEPDLSEAAYRKGAKVFAAAAKRWGIPIQPAIVDGCRIVRAGIIDHDALDCGNNHTDIRPFSVPKLIRYTKQAAGAGAPEPPKVDYPYRVCSLPPRAKRPSCINTKDLGRVLVSRLEDGHRILSVSTRT